MANIKTMFPEFFQSKLKDSDLESNASNLIVLDTNFLLDILQMPTDIAKTYVEALDKVKDNLYIPYLVALEFNFRKSGIKKEKIYNINKYKDNVKKPIESLKTNILDYSLIKIKENSESFSGELIAEVNSFQTKISEMLNKKVAETITKEEHTLYEHLISIIEDRIGAVYSQDWIDEVETDGENRYEKKVPPGFDDDSKDQENEKIRQYGNLHYQRKFGDLIIWKDIIDYSREHASEGPKVVYITNDGQSDKKNDLLYKVNNLIVGPHISLMNELQVEADKELHILSNLRFVQLVSKLNDEQMKEIERLSISWNDSPTTISASATEINNFFIDNLEKERQIEEDMEREAIEKAHFMETYERNPFEKSISRDEIERRERAHYIRELQIKRRIERANNPFVENTKTEQTSRDHLSRKSERDEIEKQKMEKQEADYLALYRKRQLIQKRKQQDTERREQIKKDIINEYEMSLGEQEYPNN